MLVLVWLPGTLLADRLSAELAMENPANPLLEMQTTAGSLFIELLPAAAPRNVARVLALASGEVEFIDEDDETSLFPNYYDNQRFHRVIPGFVIQAASPAYHPLGAPAEALPNEINAEALGLDVESVLNIDGSVNSRLNVLSQEDFAMQVLRPLYQAMNIDDVSALANRQQAVLDRLRQLTVQALYEMQGYRFSDDLPTRPVTRGTMVLVNSGPGSNGAEFFIALSDQPSLTGKYTVIGHVVEGMDVVDRIGATTVDPLQNVESGTVITSLRRVNASDPEQ